MAWPAEQQDGHSAGRPAASISPAADLAWEWDDHEPVRIRSRIRASRRS